MPDEDYSTFSVEDRREPKRRFTLRGKSYVMEGSFDSSFVMIMALLALEDPRVDEVLKTLHCALLLDGQQIWPEEEAEERDPLLLYNEVRMEKAEQIPPLYKIVCATGHTTDAEIFDPDGKKMSGIEVVKIEMDEKKPFTTATIQLNRVAVEMKAKG
jgi:hypothetical protein